MWFLSCMEGFAADWALPHVERIIARDFTGITENMVSLEKAFLTAFGDPDAKRAAQRKLQELVQTGTIHEYTTEFRTLVAELDLSNDGLMMDYEKGLHWRVKEALAMREVIPTTYEELVAAATRYDNARRENDARRPQRSTQQTTQRQTKPGTATATTRATVKLEDSPNFVSNEEKDRRRTAGVCLKCGKAGHGIKDCRTGWRKEGKKEEKREKGNAAKIETTSNEESELESENE